MYRRIYIALCLLLAVLGVQAQSTMVPSVSNYHLTWTTINPAFAGFRDVLSLSTMYRSPLYGGVGPTDMQLNGHTPVGDSKVAIGAVVAYNSSPPSTGLYSLMTNYAYRMYLGSGRLSFGLSAGLYGVNNREDNYDTRDEEDPSFGYGAYRRWFPNFGAGVLYYAENFFVGLSVPELFSVPVGDENLSASPRNYRYILTGAYEHRFSENFSLKPSLIIDYNRASTTFKASVNAGLLKNRLYLGVAYDNPNYLIALLNVQVNPQWLIGYAYTIGVSEVRTALGGSHEVVLRWELVRILKSYERDPFYF